MGFDVTKPFPQVVREDGRVGHMYKFDDLEQLQAAMANLVTIANGQGGKVAWVFLRAGFVPGDVLPQSGYVGVKFKAD